MCANKQTYNKQSLIHHFDHNNHYDHHKDIFVIYIYHLIYIRNILVDILNLFWKKKERFLKNLYLRYRITLDVSIFFTRFMVLTQCYSFQVQGRLVTSQQKCYFFCLHIIFACRLVLNLYACAIKNP